LAAVTAGSGHAAGFDSARAWSLLRHEVQMGPRPTGSPANRALAAYIRARLPHGRYEDEPGGVRNVVGQLPGRGKAILVAAHYDTKLEPFRFVGANDGAGGTAELLELARALRHVHRARGAPPIRFVAFDGEESPHGDNADFYATGLRGSRPYAARHAHELRAMILLDFVANKDLAIPREAGSDVRLWSRLRAASRRAGVARAFPDALQGEVLDDHTPFARRGVPSIDLIDFDFPCWHRACDDLSAVSQRSLGESGAAVLELLRSWR
jgi:Zn-dependent M28 family amino/carboxypeptidase